jgi:hypothetical protein
MNFRSLGVVACCLGIVACQTAAGVASSPAAPQPTLDELLAPDTSLDLAYNTLAHALIANVGALTPAQKTQAKALMGQLYQAVAAADAADELGQSTTLIAEAAAAGQLVGQINQLLPSAARVALPAAPSPGAN